MWWFLLVPWLALPQWAAMARKWAWKWTEDPSTPSFRKTLLAGFLVVVFLLWFSPVRWLVTHRPRKLDQSASKGTPWQLAMQLQAPPESQFPFLPKLAQELAQHFPNGRFTGTIFASETLGDYLLWALPNEMPVAMYAHPHLFPRQHWDDFLKAKFGEPGAREFLERHRANLVVVEAELCRQLAADLRNDPGWTIILDETGDRAKRNPRDRLFIALRNVPAGR
jgi:hypothetical protein